MPDAPRCDAPKSRGRGACRAYCIKRPGGGYTTRCRNHGGTRELLPRGDPGRGGRPAQHFSYCEVVPEAYRPIYDAAREQLGKLDHELALARTNLYRFGEKRRDQEKGGIPTAVSGGGASVSVRTYEQIEGEYLDRIARLEEKRARILQILQELDVPPPPTRVVVEDAGAGDAADGQPTDEVRQRLREKLLRDDD